jgi:hypothetical protein
VKGRASSERLLSLSARLYRCLVRLYPPQFRSEYGPQMVQAFRDGCREELCQRGIIRLIALWGHTLLDLVVTAPLEHMRKGELMNTREKDLRWDVRYGLQMLFRHSIVLLKYSTWVLGALFSLFAVALLVTLLGSSLLVWRKERPLEEAWKQTIGQTPEEFYQSVLGRFPKTEMNEAAGKLEVLSAKLGVINPKPRQAYVSQVSGVRGPFNQYDTPAYLDAQLKKASDDLDEAPEEVRNYLQAHAADLAALYSLVRRGEVPRWEMDLSRLCEAPVPNFLYHRQLQGVIALDILEKTSSGQNKPALEALEASWKIDQSLRERPELISQLIGLTILNRQAGVLRKMKAVPVEWQSRLLEQDLQGPFLQALQLDVLVISKFLSSTDQRFSGFGWADAVINSPLGKPFRRLMSTQMLEVTRDIISELKPDGFCSFNPDSFLRRIEGSLSDWNAAKSVAGSYCNAWKDATRSLLNIDLTQKILVVKQVREAFKKGDRQRQAPEMESLLCPGVKWAQRSSTDGTVRITSSNLPDWITKEHRNADLSVAYCLRPKG